MKLSVDFSKSIGKIKAMHAVGQPPIYGMNFSYFHYLQAANIPYSRLHDTGGAYGRNVFVDIPNIFRDFDADENDPASYHFAFTDSLLAGLAEYGVKPYFRLGVTIENYAKLEAFRIYPPKDAAKWARVCEHIIRHYNEGWANGYHYDIEYWEIWNEPDSGPGDVSQMWFGTMEQYFDLYKVASAHLKDTFGDKIKVGGYAACGFYGVFADPEKYGLSFPKRDGSRYHSPKEEYRVNFFLNFIKYVKEHHSPMDFFSWHTYGGVDTIVPEADFVDKVLSENGYGHIETHLNEWNLSHDRKINNGTSYASANVMAIMLAMQHKKTDMLMYYDARYVSISTYGGFYDLNTFEPSNVYYAFKAFGELYALGNEAECICGEDGIYALAATDGEKSSIILSNLKEDTEMKLNLPDGFSVYIIDKDNLFTKTDLYPEQFILKEKTVAIIKNF